MPSDRGVDVVMDVVAVDQFEEPVAFQHLEDLRLHPREVQVDVVVDAGLSDRDQDVGALRRR